MELPIRSNVPYSTTLRIFSWASRGIEPISSRKSVPPSAASKRPGLLCAAPVKAPFSWPNNSDSMRDGDKVAQLRVTKGPFHRFDKKCSRLAASSLPVPLSPIKSTGRSTGATRDKRSWKSRNTSDCPNASPRDEPIISPHLKFDGVRKTPFFQVFATSAQRGDKHRVRSTILCCNTGFPFSRE